MILWTIQNEEVYETLQKTGVYHANEEYLLFRDVPSIETVYDWMADKMAEKISPPPQGVHYPIRLRFMVCRDAFLQSGSEDRRRMGSVR